MEHMEHMELAIQDADSADRVTRVLRRQAWSTAFRLAALRCFMVNTLLLLLMKRN